MNYDETVVVDAIATDIETLSLPRHGLTKYFDPRVVRLDQQPRILCVYPTSIDHNIIATPDAYDNYLQIKVAWYAPVFSGAEYNQGDQQVALSALQEARVIRRHLQSYAAGVPGLVNVSAVLIATDWNVEGSVTWKAEITLLVEQFEGGPSDG